MEIPGARLLKQIARYLRQLTRAPAAAHDAPHRYGVAMNSLPIDTSFDFRAEPNCSVDPDRRSPTLQRYQKLLFSKALPSGVMFNLSEKTSGIDHVLVHESDLGTFELSSDTILNSSKGPLKSFYDELPADVNAAWHRSSIGARLLFPGNQVDGKWTINQARGMTKEIRDRFDLTLEAIRRHYLGESSPLTDVLARYKDFFALFENFDNYVDFFLLNDLVNENGSVRFYIPFGGFDKPALPATFQEYVVFRNAQLDFLAGRTQRIEAYQTENLK
ncbi:hypothetical protein V6245_09065 [Salinibacterium amurskyense]|uniref:DUF6994 family protein n=1 Tax=Salinibacterium amurskyense TaxID=205941 RepID=UPI0031204E2E